MHGSKQKVTSWSLTNEHGLELFGNTHAPSSACACAIILHGFKGYKDYGFIPVLASKLAESGVLVHRFNFSTSGMTNEIETFARPDLFALDTWKRQVDDVRCVVRAIRSGALRGRELPITLIGHSRGGATAILAGALHKQELELASIATINAVDSCARITDEQREQFREQGYIETQSARTKQTLRIHSDWLQEQLDDPASHDVCALAARVGVELLVMHGDEDQAVDVRAGEHIANNAGAELKIIAGADHVLNTKNPASVDETASAQLMFVLTNIRELIESRSREADIDIDG
jgi:alpha-beta hydrolase superfamily lysophospholipase